MTSPLPWMDAGLPPTERASTPIAELTLDEMISLVHGPMPALLGDRRRPTRPLGAGYIPGIARLGMPALHESDASLGVTNPRRCARATWRPRCRRGLALARWDRSWPIGPGRWSAARRAPRASTCCWRGGVNLTREPRNGRNFEYLGEDPLLAGHARPARRSRGIQAQPRRLDGQALRAERPGDRPPRASTRASTRRALRETRPAGVPDRHRARRAGLGDVRLQPA